MRLLVALGAIAVAFCVHAQTVSSDVEQAVTLQLQLHPQSTLIDIYKSFVQDRFGAGHLIPDTLTARRMLLGELSKSGDSQGPVIEPCGATGRYVRADLSLVRDSIISFQQYFDAFRQGLEAVDSADIAQWATEWSAIADRIQAMDLDIPGFVDDREAIARMLSQGRYAVHHSRQYAQAYRPHYRIIRADLLAKIINLNCKN